MASANPQTMPLGSAAGTSVTAATTPDVPIDTTTSPARAPTPNAAAALSPVPGPSTAFPGANDPAASAGASTRGRRASWPNASRSRSGRYVPVAADQ